MKSNDLKNTLIPSERTNPPSCIFPNKNTPLFLKEKSSFAKAVEENGEGKKTNQIIMSLRPQGRASYGGAVLHSISVHAD